MRLNKSVKDEILSGLKLDVYASKEKVMQAEEEAYALKCATSLLTAADKKLMKLVPDKWLQERTELRGYFAGNYKYLDLPKGTLLPRCFDHTHSFDAGTPLGDEYDKLAGQWEDTKKEWRKLEVNVYGLLNSVTTIKRLLEAWPEGEKYIPTDASMTSLPMVEVKSINSAIKKMKK